ncbi:MAG: hypothetical protein QXH20_02520 [Candidatus Bathyarchaeia archaeon]
MECVARKLDPAGFPDFTYPVSIKAMTIESLAVDIKAQTVPVLKVDIAAQSLSALSVNIVACAATLNVNIVSQGDFYLNVNIAASAVTLNVAITSSVTLNVAIQSSAVTLNVNVASQSVTINVKTAANEHVDTDIVSSVTLPINIVAQTITTLAVDIKAQSAGNLNVNIAASAATLNVNILSQSVSISVKTAANEHVDTDIVSSVTLPINIVAQTITTLGVDIKAQSVGNLNVNIVASAVTLNVAIQSTAVTLPVSIQSSAVTFNVNIVSQAVDINVKTSSGANIVIDKLTQGAYTERRSTLQNNGATALMVAYNLSYARGKFFPRGCRGFITSVEIYCDNLDSVAHTFTIHFAPVPGMGDVFKVALSVPANASAAWRTVTILKMWNYDSMFIWVECDSDAYGRLGYDDGEPYDYYFSTDRVVWNTYLRRFWFRVGMAGETVGDLPVSGTVNAIEVPVSSVGATSDTVSLNPTQSQTILTILEPGENLLFTYESNNPDIAVRIQFDDANLLIGTLAYISPTELYNWGFTAGTPGLSLLKIAAAGSKSSFIITVPFRWKKKLTIIAYNASNQSGIVDVGINYVRCLG